MKFKANGLMRAVESVFASSNRRGVPVTVQLIYFSMRQSGRSYFVNLGGTAGIYILSQLLGQDFFMVYLYVEKIPQFYWGLKKALAKTEKAGKRPPKNVEEKLNLQV